ncbi:MAG TPA: MOSC domain-containing protein [Bacteroidota bacterium]|nr:MOSC domain-containing protein [Bacteroidota bacterium]
MSGTLRVISVNIGLPRQVKWMGKLVTTGIFKEPVVGRIRIGPMNLEGDRQADLSVHGGPYKAVYAYAAEHYAAWRNELSGRELPWGMFGENLTVRGGLFEDEIYVGDHFTVGTAELVAAQPRLPCYKLGMRFGTLKMVKRFANSGRYGVYFSVFSEGDVGVNDMLVRTKTSAHRVSIGDVGRLLLDRVHDPVLLKRAIDAEGLPERVRRKFEAMLHPARL